METYGLLALGNCETNGTTITFNLKMSKIGFDTFALVVNFIDEHCVPKHIIVGLFKAQLT
jgi:hypothetical protein